MELTVNIKGEEQKAYACYNPKTEELYVTHRDVTGFYEEVPPADLELLYGSLESIALIIEENPIAFLEENKFIKIGGKAKIDVKTLEDYTKGNELDLEMILKDAEELGIDIPKFLFINYHKNEWDIWQKGLKKNCNSVEIQGDETVKVTLGYTGDWS